VMMLSKIYDTFNTSSPFMCNICVVDALLPSQFGTLLIYRHTPVRYA